LGAHNQSTTEPEIRAAVEAAGNWGTYVTVHAYTPPAIRQALAAGVKCIEHGQLRADRQAAGGQRHLVEPAALSG